MFHKTFHVGIGVKLTLCLLILFASPATYSDDTWTIKGELDYLQELGKSDYFFAESKSFIFVIQEIASSPLEAEFRSKGDFALIVQSSPDSGIFRAVFAKKCDSGSCQLIVMKDLKFIQYVPHGINNADISCPKKQEYGPIPNSTLLINPGAASNYFVCRTEGVLHRFGISGGQSLPVSDLPMLNKYLRETFHAAY